MLEIKHDIFLSYSRKDIEHVRPIVQLLEAQRWSVWWDPKLPHGVDYANYIEEQLNNSKLVIVVWSSPSIKSKWVRAEANDGLDRDVLFPIKIEDIKPPLIFRPIQTANFIDWKGNPNTYEVASFIHSIRERLKSITVQQSKIIGGFQDIIGTNGMFMDNRDGQSYSTIKIGEQIWMSEGLNYEIANSWCYNNEPREGKKYGRLYTWEAAKKACPKGWHLPTSDEWNILIDNFGGKDEAYKELILGGNTNFEARLGGIRDNNGAFNNLRTYGYFWSNTEQNNAKAWSYGFLGEYKKVYRSGNDKTYAFSCRYIKD